MPTKTGTGVVRHTVRWMYGSITRGLVFSCVLLLLLTLGYLRLMNAIGGKPSHGCPKAVSDISKSALPGRYTGTGGMEIRLASSGFRVKSWRYGGYEHGDDSLGSFEGSGTWEYESRSGAEGMQIRLDFFEGPEPGNPDPIAFLTVGGDRARPVLFDDVDPDVCPDIVLTRGDGG